MTHRRRAALRPTVLLGMCREPVVGDPLFRPVNPVPPVRVFDDEIPMADLPPADVPARKGDTMDDVLAGTILGQAIWLKVCSEDAVDVVQAPVVTERA